jgi:hypothetical protein
MVSVSANGFEIYGRTTAAHLNKFLTIALPKTLAGVSRVAYVQTSSPATQVDEIIRQLQHPSC